MNLNKLLFLLILPALLLTAACNEDATCEDCGPPEIVDEPIQGPYNPQDYTLALPDWLNAMPLLPDDNPLTVEGVELGRHLFYDPILSLDSTISCSTCHLQELAFTDGVPKAVGIEGRTGDRNSMSLANLAWNPGKFFWDGRSNSLEAQALVPIEDHREMGESWENVEEKLRRHPEYPRRFRAAFGIDKKGEINRELVVDAISQFERTMISFDSKFDRVVNRNEGWFSDLEELGRDLFFIEDFQDLEHPGCSHCHVGLDLTDHSFRNNGLDEVDDLADFPDTGLGGVTGNYYDNGKFRVPTLRNVELTAPYMHDGRFATLEEVIDHYSEGGHGAENEDVNIQAFSLTAEEKQALVAFLKTLTDPSFINDPELSSPF